MSDVIQSRWRTYPEYKDSGVEWLGEIPSHWESYQLRRGIEFLTDFEANGSFSDIKDNTNINVGEFYAWYVRATDLENQRFGAVEGNHYCDISTYEFLRKTKLFGGELLITKRGEIGKVYLMPFVDCPATLAPNLYLVRLNENLHPVFISYWFRSSYGKPQLILANKSTTIGALYKDDVKGCITIFPPLEEQRAIADFLDRETERIDTLIAKKRELITLLKEQRQAIISHAVTRGLDPDAPMKDSGVPWLGEIPAHWEVGKLKYMCSLLRDGTHQPPKRVESDGYPLLSVRNIQNGEFGNLPDDSLISKEDFLELERSFKVKENDVLLAIVGATLGKTAIVPKIPPFTIQRSLAVFRPRPQKIHFRFLWYYFSSDNFQKLLWTNVGYSAQPGIYLGALSDFYCTVPSISEQLEIIDALDGELEQISTIIAKTQATIERLEEYRTELISAAVTGKIDVRGEL